MNHPSATGGGFSIPLSVPHLAGNEWAYVKECLDTNWVSYVGSFVTRFEQDLAVNTGAQYTVALSSGTAALHLALLLAGVGPEEEVIMPAVSFVAPANAVRYCYAWPVFTDIRSEDWQWDVEQLGDFLAGACEARNGRIYNKATGRRIAALMPVHLLGGMCDLDAVAGLASRYELPLIEDAAECLGAAYKDRPIGAASSCYSGPMRLVITSFNGNKIITTGGGGALLTDDAGLAAKARHLSTTAKAGGVEFFHDSVGYNYRLTNMAAALGVAQLEQLEQHVEAKRAIALRYQNGLSRRTELFLHPEPLHCRSTFWMYTVRIKGPARPLIDDLNRRGVMSRPIWNPLPSLPVYRDCYSHRGVEIAHAFCREALSLPCSVGLTPAEQDQAVRFLCSLL